MNKRASRSKAGLRLPAPSPPAPSPPAPPLVAALPPALPVALSAAAEEEDGGGAAAEEEDGGWSSSSWTGHETPATPSTARCVMKDTELEKL